MEGDQVVEIGRGKNKKKRYVTAVYMFASFSSRDKDSARYIFANAEHSA